MINIMLLEPLLMQKYSKHCDEWCHNIQQTPHQIFGQALQSVNESVRFSDEAFHGEFCLSENRTSVLGVKDELFFFGRALARAKNFFRESDEVKSTLK